MRRLLTIVVLLGGCGRLGFDDMGGGGSNAGGLGSNAAGAPGVSLDMTPNVCTTRNWTINTLGAGVDLAVTTTPTGAAVFAVPTSTGSISGFELDAQMNVIGGLKTVLSGTYISSAANFVDGKLIVGGVNGGSRALVDIVPMGLGAASEIGNVDGMFVSKNPLLNAGADRVTPTACSAGLTVNPYDGSWNAIASALSVTTNQSTAIASTTFGTDAMVVWSTTNDCHLEHLTSHSAGVGGAVGFACSSPSIAANSASATGLLVYEASDGVFAIDFDTDTLGASPMKLAPGATSPRVIFDGAEYWISYLDSSGELVVGFINAAAEFVSTTVTGTQPEHDAYQLLATNSGIWVISADATSFGASRICIGL